MKNLVFAVIGLLLIASIADANEVVLRNRFPVATAVGRGINRVVGFPARVVVAAFRPNRVQRVVIANHNVQQVRVQRVVFNHDYVQQIRVQRFVAPVYAQQVYAQQVVAPVYAQQVVAQLGTTNCVQPEQIQQEVVTAPKIVTQKVILRQGYCGGTSQFRY